MIPWFFSTRKQLFSWNASLLLLCQVCLESFSPYISWAVPLSRFCSHFEFGLMFDRSSAQLGWALWCESGAYKPVLCLHYSWCRSFFCVFGLLVALNITSGDLKLCKECVIVEFL